MSDDARRGLFFCLLSLATALLCCGIIAVTGPDDVAWTAYFGFWGVVTTYTFVAMLDDLLSEVWPS